MLADSTGVLGKSERFSLFTECQSVSVIVEDIPGKWALADIRKATVRTATESRMKAAGFFKAPKEDPTLQIAIVYLDDHYSYSVALFKIVADLSSESLGHAITWQRKGVGVEDDSERTMADLMDLVDSFLTQYRRANEAACETKGKELPDLQARRTLMQQSADYLAATA